MRINCQILAPASSCIGFSKGQASRDKGRLVAIPQQKVATSNKCHASSNKCLTSSNKKLLELDNSGETCRTKIHDNVPNQTNET